MQLASASTSGVAPEPIRPVPLWARPGVIQRVALTLVLAVGTAILTASAGALVCLGATIAVTAIFSLAYGWVFESGSRGQRP
jgi:hypothetical protein